VTQATRNVNEAMVGSYGVFVWRESGVRRSVFVLVRLTGIWFSVTGKMFSHLINFIKKSYKCFIFNEICRDNISINYTSYAIQQKLIFLNFDRSYARLISDIIQTVDGVQALMHRPLAFFVRSTEMPS
jgi:hypothetical protein